MNVLLFVNRSPVEGQLNCFQFSAIMNKDAINVHVQVCSNISFHFSGLSAQKCNCWIVWYVFSFIRNCQTVFQSGCTILHFHQQCLSDRVSLHICQHFFLAILIGV